MRFDVVVIGSGFGGSVAALRLVEKGYRVAVLEAGRRFADDELPETSWRMRRFLWAPALGCYGIQRLTLLRGAAGKVLVLSGAGVGGGSLVYANTLYEPLPDFYDDPQWRHITDWRTELAPHYDQAKRMLGVTEYPRTTAADRAMRAVADRMGVGHTFHPTPVGVFLGRPGERVPDPYFGGVGPDRTGCTHCGACMTGCRLGAKNTLVKNYLWLAEQTGASVFPLTTAVSVRPSGSGYEVTTVRTGALVRRRSSVLVADQVIFAAGALGTQRLLHRMRATGALPALSARVGALTRTNSEAILGASVPRRAARRRKLDFSDGVAITSSFHPDPRTHIEPVRYGRGSNAMGLLQTALVPGGPRRTLRWLGILARKPLTYLPMLSVRQWSSRTVIALVMQSFDNSLTTRYRRRFGRFGGWSLRSTPGHGAPNPTWIPAGASACEALAEEIGGIPGGSITEAFDTPVTAHILGGAAIGATSEDGVIDPYHRVYGHPGLHVVDGAAVTANLGVNPSLTIAAQAERALSMWPNRGEADPRPALGTAYVPVDPVPPAHPAVPPDAPAALRR
ncbi:FAD-dependent oxidoreductase [Virgisporangium aurantiacum]|uniref:Cholesterol oxidase n=1 Tax=Virgisporangium aurantiacum TaxID=175570 RepID=A0A8J3Z892_9ACTN|nr:GMC family oxidoreductase [Virgisporangium aurantiacum]GIJ59314.1 cholesterol oxidase [Virgisporangium aurantiacum]